MKIQGVTPLILFLLSMSGCGGTGSGTSVNQGQTAVSSSSSLQDGADAFSTFYNNEFRSPLTINPLTNALLLTTADPDMGRTLVPWAVYKLDELIDERSQRSVLVTNFTRDTTKHNLVSNVYGTFGCLLIYEGVANPAFGSTTWGKRDGREYVYQKVDSARFLDPTGAEIKCIGGYGETFGAADFNRDGLMDLVVTTYERNYLFKNSGDYQFLDVTPSFMVKPNYLPTVEGVIVADLFKRGRYDIVLNNFIAVNDGDFKFHVVEPGNGFDSPDEGMVISDLDNDGFFEIVRLQPNPPIVRIFKVIAENNIKLVKSIDISNARGFTSSEVFGLGIGDLYSKGCDDIVIAGGKPNGTRPLILKNDCKMNFEYVDLGRSEGFFSNQILVADVDGDTVPDIVSRGSSVNDRSLSLLNGSNSPLQQRAAEGNFISINKSLKRNNLQLSLTEYGDVFLGSGRTIEVAGQGGFSKVFSLNATAGFLSYGNLRVAGYIDPSKCPFAIRVFGSPGYTAQLGCDAALEGPRSAVFGLSSHSDIRTVMNVFNELGTFNLTTLKKWIAGDGATVTDNSPVFGEFRLNNTLKNWGYIRKIMNNPCAGTLRIEGELRQGTTFPGVRIGSNSGVWDIVEPSRVSGYFQYNINHRGTIVVDLYNEDPFVSAYSILASLKGYCSN
jgi:hypothetical protein